MEGKGQLCIQTVLKPGTYVSEVTMSQLLGFLGTVRGQFPLTTDMGWGHTTLSQKESLSQGHVLSGFLELGSCLRANQWSPVCT